MLDLNPLEKNAEVDQFYDDRDSTGSDIEFVKSVTKSHVKVECASTVDDTYANIPSSEGSASDEGKDTVDEGNPCISLNSESNR